MFTLLLHTSSPSLIHSASCLPHITRPALPTFRKCRSKCETNTKKRCTKNWCHIFLGHTRRSSWTRFVGWPPGTLIAAIFQARERTVLSFWRSPSFHVAADFWLVFYHFCIPLLLLFFWLFLWKCNCENIWKGGQKLGVCVCAHRGQKSLTCRRTNEEWCGTQQGAGRRERSVEL